MFETRYLSVFFCWLLCVAGFAGCDNNDDERAFAPFRLEKESYEVMMKGRNMIFVTNGSGDFALTVEKPALLDAVYESPVNDPSLFNDHPGAIRLVGKQKGETKLTVTDRVTGETQTVRIKVTDSYIAYSIRESDHPALTGHTILYFIHNPARDCYFITVDPQTGEFSATPAAKGAYRFSVETEGEGNPVPYLTLVYSADEQGRLTDAAIAPEPHRFDLSGNNPAAYTALESALGFRWNDLRSETSLRDINKAVQMRVTETGTAYSVEGELTIDRLFPEGILE